MNLHGFARACVQRSGVAFSLSAKWSLCTEIRCSVQSECKVEFESLPARSESFNALELAKADGSTRRSALTF